MKFAIDLYSDFMAAEDLDQLWDKLHKHLEHFGISNIVYIVTHSPQAMIGGISIAPEHVQSNEHQNHFDQRYLPADFFRNSYSQEYREHFEESFFLTDDLSTVHCATKTTPFVWHADHAWDNANQRQQLFYQDAQQLGMDVGVSIPLRFSYTGGGGMGLRAGYLNKAQFNTMWAHACQYITHVCYLFDEIARRQFSRDLITALSHREREVLSRIANGEAMKTISSKLHISDESVATYLARARNKLKARNNTQAVIKAMQYEFIDL